MSFEARGAVVATGARLFVGDAEPAELVERHARASTTSPIGSGSPPTAVSHASPPSWSFTSFGALSCALRRQPVRPRCRAARGCGSRRRRCDGSVIGGSLLVVRRPQRRLTPMSGTVEAVLVEEQSVEPLARRGPGRRPRAASRPRWPGACSPTSAPRWSCADPPDGDPLRALPDRWDAWTAGKQSRGRRRPDDPALDALLAGADIVHRHARLPRRVDARPRASRRTRSG